MRVCQVLALCKQAPGPDLICLLQRLWISGGLDFSGCAPIGERRGHPIGTPLWPLLAFPAGLSLMLLPIGLLPPARVRVALRPRRVCNILLQIHLAFLALSSIHLALTALLTLERMHRAFLIGPATATHVPAKQSSFPMHLSVPSQSHGKR